jgi:AraC family transcriptional regulator
VHPSRFRQFRGGIPRVRLHRVIDYIEASVARKLHLNELAQVAEMSPYYFGKLFKETTGWTVHQYVMQRRIHRAMYLLGAGSLSIAEAGAAVGVTNQSQFSRLFRQQTGTTPRRYQAELGRNQITLATETDPAKKSARFAQRS